MPRPRWCQADVGCRLMLNIAGQRIAITGAGGFIGAALCRAASQHGAEVLAIGPGTVSSPCVTAIPARIETEAALAAHLDGVSILIHAAGRGTPTGIAALHDGLAMDELRLTAVVLEAACRAGVGRVVLVSSGGTVYGDPVDATPMAESHALCPRSRYGAVKLLAEEMAWTVNRMGLVACVVARLSNPYGPGQVNRRGQGLIATVAACVQSGEPIEIWGDGTTVRDYLFIDDATTGLLAAGLLPGGMAVNVSSGVGLQTRAVVADVLAQLGVEHPVRFRTDKHAGVASNILSNVLLQTRTDWTPQIAWPDGLARTVRWWRRTSVEAVTGGNGHRERRTPVGTNAGLGLADDFSDC